MDVDSEREDGEIVDGLEEVSDCSITSNLCSGKSVAYQDIISSVSVSSISDSEHVRLPRNVYPLSKRRHHSPTRKARRKRRSEETPPRHHHRPKKRHRAHTHKPVIVRPSITSSDSETERVDRRTLRQLKEAIRINTSSHVQQNDLQTRIKKMIEPDVIEIEDDPELDKLREMALSSTKGDSEALDRLESLDVSVISDDDMDLDSNSEDKVTNDTMEDSELRELRLEALKSAILKKCQKRKERKNNESDVNKENTQDNINTDLTSNDKSSLKTNISSLKIDNIKNDIKNDHIVKNDNIKDNNVINDESIECDIISVNSDSSKNEIVTKNIPPNNELEVIILDSPEVIKIKDTPLPTISFKPKDPNCSTEEDLDILRATLLAQMSEKITSKKLIEKAAVIEAPSKQFLSKTFKTAARNQFANLQKTTSIHRVPKSKLVHNLLPKSIITAPVKPLIIQINGDSDSEPESPDKSGHLSEDDGKKESVMANIDELLKRTRAQYEMMEERQIAEDKIKSKGNLRENVNIGISENESKSKGNRVTTEEENILQKENSISIQSNMKSIESKEVAPLHRNKQKSPVNKKPLQSNQTIKNLLHNPGLVQKKAVPSPKKAILQSPANKSFNSSTMNNSADTSISTSVAKYMPASTLREYRLLKQKLRNANKKRIRRTSQRLSDKNENPLGKKIVKAKISNHISTATNSDKTIAEQEVNPKIIYSSNIITGSNKNAGVRTNAGAKTNADSTNTSILKPNVEATETKVGTILGVKAKSLVTTNVNAKVNVTMTNIATKGSSGTHAVPRMNAGLTRAAVSTITAAPTANSGSIESAIVRTNISAKTIDARLNADARINAAIRVKPKAQSNLDVPLEFEEIRLQMKGKYKETAPILHRIDQARIEKRKCEETIKRLLLEMKEARTKLSSADKNYKELLQLFMKHRAAIDASSKSASKPSFAKMIIGLHSTSTPIKQHVQETKCDISNIENINITRESDKIDGISESEKQMPSVSKEIVNPALVNQCKIGQNLASELEKTLLKTQCATSSSEPGTNTSSDNLICEHGNSLALEIKENPKEPKPDGIFFEKTLLLPEPEKVDPTTKPENAEAPETKGEPTNSDNVRVLDKQCDFLSFNKASPEISKTLVNNSINLVEDCSNCDSSSRIGVPEYISPLNNWRRDQSSTDPLAMICPFETYGACKDSECTYKHYS